MSKVPRISKAGEHMTAAVQSHSRHTNGEKDLEEEEEEEGEGSEAEEEEEDQEEEEVERGGGGRYIQS